MVRVCKPNHKVGIIDLLSPEGDAISKTYNHLEKLRDPSHTFALSKSQMLTMMAEVGLTIDSINARDIKVDFQKWVQMTGVNSETIEQIRGELLGEINGKTITGTRPFDEQDSLKFLQVWAIVIGEKTIRI